jgi:hypothetical protein
MLVVLDIQVVWFYPKVWVVVPHQQKVLRVGVVAAVAVAVGLQRSQVLLVAVLNPMHLSVLPSTRTPQHKAVAVLVVLPQARTDLTVEHHKAVVVAHEEQLLLVAMVATVATLVVVVAAVAVQQTVSTQVQAVMAATHKSRYGCSDEISRIER